MDRWRSPAEQWLTQPGPEPEIVEPIDCNSLTYLQSVYRDPSLPAGQRMRAAIECLPFETPKLSGPPRRAGTRARRAAATNFAERLKRAVIRSRQGPKLIEHSPPPPTIDHRPATSVPDRRFQRA
jgi:hypothetical protein